MYSLVVRWPGVVSVVAWAAMLVVALVFVGSRGNVGTHTWLTVVVFVLVLCGAAAAWYLAYRALPGGRPPESVVRLLYGAVLAAFLLAGLLVEFGAALFVLWIAYAASVAQVGWYTGHLRGERAAMISREMPNG
ncbi:hypothetical protein [Actinoallomurus sp. CA-142502]|uniref:hypothetical protein n=1 Tax=Actinoallomurus sp. CA-142502 TaxID=3239885 RepID=UPI003D8A429A